MARLSFPKAILKLRAHLNIPREKLALEAGVTASAVSYWETGDRTPNDVHREKLLTYARAVSAPAEIIAGLDFPNVVEARP